MKRANRHQNDYDQTWLAAAALVVAGFLVMSVAPIYLFIM